MAGAAGQNTVGGATAAENEALNNSTEDHRSEAQKAADEIHAQQSKERAGLGGGGQVLEGYDATGNPIVVEQLPTAMLGGRAATNTSSALQQAINLFSSNARGTLAIGGSTFTELPNNGNAAIFACATDAQVQQYFMQLSGASEMPAARTIPGQGTIYVVKTPQGNFTLRDFAGSSAQSGAAWTIDVPGGAVGKTYNPEIKFLR